MEAISLAILFLKHSKLLIKLFITFFDLFTVCLFNNFCVMKIWFNFV